MTLLDSPLDARFGRIEDRLTAIERDVAELRVDISAIKTRLDALAAAIPSRWTQWLFALAIIMPLYGILVTLLWTTVHH